MYNIYIMNGVFVTAITQRKRAELERVFGTDQLPVTSSRPRMTAGRVLAYTLDKSRLHWMQIRRLADYLAKRDKLDPSRALALIDVGLPIPASEVAIVQEIEQDTDWYPAFRLWYTRPLSTAAVFC